MSSSEKTQETLGSEPLSIAVISPDDLRRNLAITALDKFPNGHIREFISYPPDIETVTRMLKKSFDVVIIDLDSDPEYTLELVENISAEGGTNVIVYSERVDPTLMVRCLRAGAREFLHTPIAPSAMTEALVRAWARRLEAPPEEEVVVEEVVPLDSDGRLFVFLSAKGGSGVTTLATSFAVSLAEQSGQRTLLIDLNLPLGDAALNLGVRSMYSSVNAFESFSRLDPHFLASLLVKHDSGLFVLSAPSEMNHYQPTDEAIGTLLKVALQCFEYVVVDAGSKLDLQRSYRLDKAVTLFLVTQLGIPELRNANRLIRKLPTEGGPNLEIVINRFDSGSEGVDESHVAKALTKPARWKIPNDYAAVRRMQNSAVSLTKEQTPIAMAIKQMTQTICGKTVEPEKEKKKGLRFFSF
jgi:pilus assembly protein CpaE